MKEDETYCSPVNARVSGRRRSSAAEVTRITQPSNPNRADVVPSNAGTRSATSRAIDSRRGEAINHRPGETFTAIGAMVMPQVKGSTGGATRPQEVDATGCRDWHKLPSPGPGIGYKRSNT